MTSPNPTIQQYIDSANLYPSIVTVSLMSFTTSILYGMLAFGDNVLFFIIYTTLEYLCPMLITIPGVPKEDQLRAIIFIMAVRSLAQNLMALKLIFKQAKWSLLKFLGPTTVVFCVIGCLFLDAFSHATWLRPLLGSIFACFGFVAFGVRFKKSWIQKQRRDEEEEKNNTKSANSSSSGSSPKNIQTFPSKSPAEEEEHDEMSSTKDLMYKVHAFSPVGSYLSPEQYEKVQDEKFNSEEYLDHIRPYLILACAGSALLGATVSVSGPPFLVASLLLLPKQLGRSIFPVMAFCTYATRFIYTASSGSMFDPKLFSVPHALNIALGGVVGVYIGDKIGKIVNNEQYLQLAASLLLCAGLSIGGASVFLLWAVLFVSMVWIVWSSWKK